MRIDLHRHLLWTAACAAIALPLAGCEKGEEPLPEYAYVCDRALSVQPVAGDSRALIVTDPAALAPLRLEAVLNQLIKLKGGVTTTPLAMMQKMFDTANDDATRKFTDVVHCDSPDNPAHVNGPAAFCPRPEGALKDSTGFFTEGDPDYFYPVAVVNRIDLMSTFATDCGQYRIVYAKHSGLTDPNNRVFIILEAVLPVADADFSGDGVMCQSVAEFWRDLESEESSAVLAENLHDFFFKGWKGRVPALTPPNLGFNSLVGTGYYGTTGQVRVSQQINEQWEYREFHLGIPLADADSASDGPLIFVPGTVGNNPLPALFGADAASVEPLSYGVEQLHADLDASLVTLAARNVTDMSVVFNLSILSGESAVGGPAINDYSVQAADNDQLRSDLADRLYNQNLSAGCPEEDPLTAESILQRTTMQSCSGCHAPSRYLGAERKIGCGMVWPDTLNPAHIDERGEISPALKDVFLPHRAKVMTKVLQACSSSELTEGLAAPAGSGIETRGAGRRTIGGSVTH